MIDGLVLLMTGGWVYGRELDTAVPPPDHYNKDSKWHHQLQMAATPIQDILAYFLYSGRKCRHSGHLHLYHVTLRSVR